MTDSTSLALLFDFGGTLDADGVPWSPCFHQAYRAAGGTLDFAAFDPIFAASDRALNRAPDIRTTGFRAAIELQARLLVGDVFRAGRDPPVQMWLNIRFSIRPLSPGRSKIRPTAT